MLKTYHEIAKPVTLLRNLRASLRPGAKVGIIDRNGNGENHGVNRSVVVKEANEAGYDVVGTYDFVKDDMASISVGVDDNLDQPREGDANGQ